MNSPIRPYKRSFLFACFMLFPVLLIAKARVELIRTEDLNLFDRSSSVSFQVKAFGFEPGGASVGLMIRDFFGAEVRRSQSVKLERNSGSNGRLLLFEVELGEMSNGYYELELELMQGDRQATASNSFGVVEFNNRTREEVLIGDYRFGMKMFGPTNYFDGFKAMEMAAQLGLHWTRAIFNKDIDALNQLPIKIIYKVEGFPEEAYDEARYGPMDAFKLRHFGWRKATLPLEAPYKEWLRKEIEKLPSEHYVYEIWNEAWGKVPEDDYAKICQWSQEVIRELRPNAVVGPNLGTHREYDSVFVQQGGMKGLNAIIMHPYGHPERSQLRARIRGARDFYERAIGGPIDLYVTEYGSPTPPGGEFASNTETAVAALNVRRSLVFYVEGVKGFMPHSLGQSERDPNEKEDWYGHFRRNMEPKPALIALGTAARLIDTSRYVGDIFYQDDVGAYLFEKDGVYTLTLWANDDFEGDDIGQISIEVQTGVDELTLVNITGGETRVKTDGGKLILPVNGNMNYLVGVSPAMESIASKKPRSDQWVRGVKRRGNRTAYRMKTPPTLDGDVTTEEWAEHCRIDISFRNIAKSDLSGTGYVAWDREWLYIAVDVIDDSPLASSYLPEDFNWRKRPRNDIPAVMADGLNVYVGSQPKYQVPEFLFVHDRHFLFTPRMKSGESTFYDIDVVTNELKPLPQASTAYRLTDRGWSAEIAIPINVFQEWPEGSEARISFEMSVTDADVGDSSDLSVIRPVDAERNYFQDATLWNFLILKDH